MADIIVIGAGFAGCAAAISAAKAGGKVTLLERTNTLTGIGVVGGLMRNNGRFTATEEMIALGGGDMFEICDSITRHVFDYPGYKHAWLYDVLKIEAATQEALDKVGVEIRVRSRARDVRMDGDTITSVVLDSGEEIGGDIFIDTTGTAGGMANCRKHGYGCVMCCLRCPTFGNRVSIAQKAGVQETQSRRGRGQETLGSISAGISFAKESIDSAIIEELEEKGVLLIPLPPALVRQQEADKMSLTASKKQRGGMVENVCIMDAGLAKVVLLHWLTLEEWRSLEGFEHARIVDPYGGGPGNSIRFLAMAPHDGTLLVDGVANLFCAGEKAGQIVGLTEAAVTGVLAGHNAVKRCLGLPYLELPRSLVVGDFIASIPEHMDSELGKYKRIAFAHSGYWEKMQEMGTYSTDAAAIHEKVAQTGLGGIFAQPVL
jgi:hypothetical protein